MIARLVFAACLALGLASCEREKRDYQPSRASSGETEVVALSSLSPGETPPVASSSPKAKDYEGNAYHLGEGKRLFQWFNCTGCHGNGGGGSGPPLMDDKWRYGGRIENIVSTIREGRPNGMPSFRGKIPDDQIWEIAGYVRSLGGNVPTDAAPSRNDDMNGHPAENRLPPEPPVTGGSAP
jgi:cytochrome c oxidase cbb3-type subunit III